MTDDDGTGDRPAVPPESPTVDDEPRCPSCSDVLPDKESPCDRCIPIGPPGPGGSRAAISLGGNLVDVDLRRCDTHFPAGLLAIFHHRLWPNRDMAVSQLYRDGAGRWYADGLFLVRQRRKDEPLPSRWRRTLRLIDRAMTKPTDRLLAWVSLVRRFVEITPEDARRLHEEAKPAAIMAPPVLVGDVRDSEYLRPVICSQAQIALWEPINRSPNTSGLLKKLKDENIVRDYERVPGQNKFRVWFTDPDLHRRALDELSGKPGRRRWKGD
jgi:hypothetical protein